jgi:hypothetical protein
MNYIPPAIETAEPRYLNRGAAAQFIRDRYGRRITREGLAKHATAGTGPVYRKFGTQAVYAEPDLIAWCEAQLSPRLASTRAQMIEHKAA